MKESAAYYALGYSRGSETPGVLICTSGTALFNYLPAIVEASVEQIPMIVLTADRPQSFSKQAQIKASIKINCSGPMYAGFLIQAARSQLPASTLFHVSTRQFTLPVIRFLVLSI